MQTDKDKPHAVPATGNAGNPAPELEKMPGEGLIDNNYAALCLLFASRFLCMIFCIRVFSLDL